MREGRYSFVVLFYVIGTIYLDGKIKILVAGDIEGSLS